MTIVKFETYPLVERINNCPTVEQVHHCVLEASGQLGVKYVFAGTIPAPGLSPNRQKEHVLFGAWPDEWTHRYFDKYYLDRDPTIRHARASTDAIRWDDLPDCRSWVMREASEFHLVDGITVPLVTSDGTRIGISFAGDRISRSDAAFIFFQFVGALATAKVIEIRRKHPIEIREFHLTPRERSCLLWAAEGKSNYQIGYLLDISVKTVESHLASCMRKMGVDNRTHMVTKAFRLGLLF